MAYEVTKLVRGRPYRYRVASERDPETGRFRNRWTYLGRADAVAGTASPVRVRRNARTALLDALERLLTGADPDAVTAAAVSAEAGVAHGTFYRYFRNKQDAIIALLARIRQEHEESDPLARPVATCAEAQAALREWTQTVLRSPERHGALIRAIYSLTWRDETLLADKRARRAAMIGRLQAAIERYVALGLCEVRDAAGSASAIAALIEGTLREAILVEPLGEQRMTATLEFVERAVFGVISRPSSDPSL
jgi:AcrR family transcriptional regulator